MAHPILIIGAGLAGWTLAREFRKRDATTPLTLVSADTGDFYAKPSLSNALAHRRTPAQLISTRAEKMASALNITLLARTQVSAINPLARTLRTSLGVLHYGKLVLATGANPIRIALQGNAAEQVFSINSLNDFSAFYALLTCVASYEKSSIKNLEIGAKLQDARAPKHILIMGAGLIGCEFANDLAGAHYKVTVVDPASSPIATLLPAPVGQQLRDALADLGVTWRFGTTVKAVNQTPNAGTGTGTGDTLALQVELSNGQVETADLVLSAVGLRANTDLAQAAGLVCERAVVVDATLQTSDAHIYALGDSAQYAQGRWAAGEALTGGRTLAYVMPIMSAAKALAATLAGTPSSVAFALMPVTLKTPALPIVVAAPAPCTPGEWQNPEPGVWHFIGASSRVLGFVLMGQQTRRRVEQAKLVST